MKSWIKISCLIVAMVSMVSMAQAQKFGYVNSAAILSEMPEVKQADANLEALQKQLQKKGREMLTKLQEDYAEVQRQVQEGNLSPIQQENESKRLQEEEAKIAKFEQDMVKQVQDKRDELLGPIYERVNQAIEDVAKENSYQFIFDQGVLLYAEEKQDVSSMVKAKLGL